MAGHSIRLWQEHSWEAGRQTVTDEGVGCRWCSASVNGGQGRDQRDQLAQIPCTGSPR